MSQSFVSQPQAGTHRKLLWLRLSAMLLIASWCSIIILKPYCNRQTTPHVNEINRQPTSTPNVEHQFRGRSRGKGAAAAAAVAEAAEAAVGGGSSGREDGSRNKVIVGARCSG